MAKRNTQWLAKKYQQALTKEGINLTGKETTKTLKKKWQKVRQSYKEQGETPPTLYEAAQQYEHDYEQSTRDDNMNTEPAPQDLDEEQALSIIQTFEADIDQMYNETMHYIDTYTAKGTTHDAGKLASIALAHISEINAVYMAIKEEIQKLTNSDIPLKVVAQAIKDNVELDYAIGIHLNPPSDLIIDMEVTLEQLQGIMAQINLRAQELAEEEEKGYYGE